MYFPSKRTRERRHMHILCRIRAETNFSLMERIRQREQENAFYIDRLCARWERETGGPDDVILEAEYRKQELAEKPEPQETLT